MRIKGLLLVMCMISMVVEGKQEVPTLLEQKAVVEESKEMVALSSDTAILPIMSDQTSAQQLVEMVRYDDASLHQSVRLVHVRPLQTHRRTQSGPASHFVSKRRLSPIKEEDEADLIIQNFLKKDSDLKEHFYDLVVSNNFFEVVPFWDAHKKELDLYDGYGAYGDSILHCAIKSLACKKDKTAAMVAYLVTKIGVPVNMQNHKQRMPLHCAVIEGHEGMVKSIIGVITMQKDDQINYMNAQDGDGYTPLHLAVKGGFTRIVGMLVVQGASVDVGDTLHNTPLHMAAQIKDDTMIGCLIAHNARRDVVNSDNETPYDVAKRNKMSEATLKLLNPACCSSCCCTGGCCTIM